MAELVTAEALKAVLNDETLGIGDAQGRVATYELNATPEGNIIFPCDPVDFIKSNFKQGSIINVINRNSDYENYSDYISWTDETNVQLTFSSGNEDGVLKTFNVLYGDHKLTEDELFVLPEYGYITSYVVLLSASDDSPGTLRWLGSSEKPSSGEIGSSISQVAVYEVASWNSENNVATLTPAGSIVASDPSNPYEFADNALMFVVNNGVTFDDPYEANAIWFGTASMAAPPQLQTPNGSTVHDIDTIFPEGFGSAIFFVYDGRLIYYGSSGNINNLSSYYASNDDLVTYLTED